MSMTEASETPKGGGQNRRQGTFKVSSFGEGCGTGGRPVTSEPEDLGSNLAIISKFCKEHLITVNWIERGEIKK